MYSPGVWRVLRVEFVSILRVEGGTASTHAGISQVRVGTGRIFPHIRET
jgi:hypothetical protein